MTAVQERPPAGLPAITPSTIEGSTRTPLADALNSALDATDVRARLDQLRDAVIHSRRDRLATLLSIYDLHTAPLDRLGVRVEYQHHPAIAALKQRCENDWLAELHTLDVIEAVDPHDTCSTLRSIAAHHRLPEVYKWLAKQASWDQLVRFLALEGGPDAGFDDLVAACQTGLAGAAKLELATNYWDEMGNGTLGAVHTVLHDQMAEAIDMAHPHLAELPTSALERTALCGLLATNRWLQPEMLGALGLIELQAGPRCRLILKAFDRLRAPRAAYPFYEVHAEVDPRHGKDWLDNAITPIVTSHPEWTPRIIAGARWRDLTTQAFLTEAHALLSD